jgi:hypothetical protein
MTASIKLVIVLLCLVLATVGFLIKIPVALRGNDKLLHTGFYFCAAAFFHLLFRKGIAIILLILALFGVLIEYLQPLMNKLTHSNIHGRFDKEDIYANCKGLALYVGVALVIWVVARMVKGPRASAG